MSSPVAAKNPQSQMTEQELTRARINAKLNDMRLSPVKQLPMTAFMMYMVGNEVSIFSIMFVGMAVINPITSIFNAGKMFEPFEEDAAADRQIRSAVNQSKWIFIGCCLVAFMVALVKINWMGMLPVNSMDWMITQPPAYKEYSVGAVV